MCQAGVLSLFADRERQLVVGHDHLGRTGRFVDANLGHLGRRERLHDELVEVLGEGNDVDLLAVQLVDDHAHTPAAGAHTGADRVDVGVVGGDRDLGALPWFTGTGLDLDDAVRDLGDLEFEEALDEAGVGTRHHDLGALRAATHLDDVRLHPLAGLRTVEGDLFGLRHEGLGLAQVEQRIPGIALLDDAGDDVALAAGVLLVFELALGFADSLAHHLLGGLSRDATEVVRGDVELLALGFAVLVELLAHHPKFAGVGVDDDPGVFTSARHLLVRRLHRIGEHREQRVDRDASLARQGVQRLHHLCVHAFSLSWSWSGSPDAVW